MIRIYLAGWLLTLLILCVAPIPHRTTGADAVSAVLLLAWPLLWVVAVVAAIMQIRGSR